MSGLRRAVPPAAIVGYSGMLRAAGRRRRRQTFAAEIKSQPPVLLVHGDRDELIPVQALLHAAQALAALDVPVEWHISPGVGHGIDQEGLRHGGEFLARQFGLRADKAGVRAQPARAALHNPVTLPIDYSGKLRGGGALRRSEEPRLNVHVSPSGFPALVLNADFRPLSYYPLSLWSWQDAIKAVFLERVNIVANYDHAVHSPSFEMKLPSVVSLKTFVKPSTHPAFTRFNVFLRDRFSCQYCGDARRPHLRPSGAALARRPHHLEQRGRRLLALQSAQGQPDAGGSAGCGRRRCRSSRSVQHLHRNGRLFPPNYLHESWLDYLYWDTELEP